MADETYGRGQIEWAIWCSFSQSNAKPEDVPTKFRTRIKRLLEIDRALDLSAAEASPSSDYAFAAPPSVEGGEVAYSVKDAFCLAVAIDLLDIGFKQSEVAFLMRYLRSNLESFFPKILEPPLLIDRRVYRSKDFPQLPSVKVRTALEADRTEFLILTKVELTEIVPDDYKRKLVGPLFLEPIYCSGVEALGATLYDLMPYHRRLATVVELAWTAQSVDHYLTRAPVIRRGRPKKKPQ